MSDHAQNLGGLNTQLTQSAQLQDVRENDAIGDDGEPCAEVVSSLQTVFIQQYGQLVRLARLRVGNAADAEDLVQDAFVAVQRAYGDREGEELRKLLFTTVRNLTVNYVKSGYVRQRRASLEIGDMQDDIACGRSVTPERQLMDSQMLDITEAVIAALPERAREALRLHRYERLTYDKIAKRMSVSPRTVKRDIAGALAAIAEGLARAG
ncbi:MAG: RNA polymerase [Henriciella sp.]|jgi:RNA polymerase sigma-70 factor (ECF subfamily)|nr:sigma-70 family RNA polymerase sigma factor [Henriciella sp.]MAN73980.1 RNA polymerase [Henriciella sp.]MBF34601.1 RNA polymerase [Hyphomonadaceae bacterium]MBK76227.1 RNA polymerase [Henriciella sp.]|tara:strand:+ start:8855 stop:9481 length:627 start_codon:yes stop_codon:yes gene_type:complete